MDQIGGNQSNKHIHMNGLNSSGIWVGSVGGWVGGGGDSGY